jgi:hypothetical protein
VLAIMDKQKMAEEAKLTTSIKDIQSQYTFAMRRHINTAKDVRDLDKFHFYEWSKAVQALQRELPVSNVEELPLRSHLEQLRRAVATTYANLKWGFQDQLQETENACLKEKQEREQAESTAKIGIQIFLQKYKDDLLNAIDRITDQTELARLHTSSCLKAEFKFEAKYSVASGYRVRKEVLQQLLGELRRKIEEAFQAIKRKFIQKQVDKERRVQQLRKAYQNFKSTLQLPTTKKPKISPPCRRNTTEAEAKLDLKQSVQNYQLKMHQKAGQNASSVQNEEELIRLHKDCKIDVFRLYAEQNPDFCEKFWTELDAQIENSFKRLRKEFKNKSLRQQQQINQPHVDGPQATLEVKRYVLKYTNALTSEMDRMRNEDQLGELHTACKKETLRKFKKYSKNKNCSDDLSYQLKEGIENSFKGLQTIFLSKLEAWKKLSVSKPVCDARRKYRKEMQQVVSKKIFERVDLKGLHQRLVTTILRELQPLQLTPAQEEDLKDQLRHMYRQFREENEAKRNERKEDSINDDFCGADIKLFNS